MLEKLPDVELDLWSILVSTLSLGPRDRPKDAMMLRETIEKYLQTGEGVGFIRESTNVSKMDDIIHTHEDSRLSAPFAGEEDHPKAPSGNLLESIPTAQLIRRGLKYNALFYLIFGAFLVLLVFALLVYFLK